MMVQMDQMFCFQKVFGSHVEKSEIVHGDNQPTNQAKNRLILEQFWLVQWEMNLYETFFEQAL